MSIFWRSGAALSVRWLIWKSYPRCVWRRRGGPFSSLVRQLMFLVSQVLCQMIRNVLMLLDRIGGVGSHVNGTAIF